MLSSPAHKVHFDEFTLDSARCVLLRGASELPLRRQSFEVLRYLAEHVGEVVSSDELIEALWSSRPADNNASVGQCIKEIRRAIGDDARWIVKTVSGRGFEFMAEVVPSVPSSPEVAPSTPATPAAVESEPAAAIAGAAAGESELPPALASERSSWRPNRLLAVTLSAALVAGGWMLWPWHQIAAPAAGSP
jgi:DNA-binding winged helix-turn-helix (wHTH) protein